MRALARLLSVFSILVVCCAAGLAQQPQGSGARAELQQSLTQRYPVTEIGGTLLGLRGGDNAIRKIGATAVLLRAGLQGATERKLAPVNLIRGDKAETAASKDARPVRAGDRFYVHSIYVGADVVEFGLMSAQPQAAPQSASGRNWVKLAFLFTPETLFNADRATVFREVDLWLGLEGGALGAAMPPAASAVPSVISAAGAPAVDAARAVVKVEAGMTQQQVVALLGEPVRAVSFGARTWLIYPGFSVQLEDDAVKSVDDAGRPARVRLRSDPDGAEVFLGEKLVASGPSTLELPAGHYVFIFRLNGYKPVRQEVDVLPGADITVSAKMER